MEILPDVVLNATEAATAACTCSEVLEPYAHDLLVVAGHIEALLWFGALWLTAFLLYKLIRVFV